MTTRAKLSATRTADLASDFGRELTEKWFPGVKIDHFPKFTKGPRKGLPKGTLHWVKAESGGWYGPLGVVRPGVIAKALVDDKNRVLIAIKAESWNAFDWFRDQLFRGGLVGESLETEGDPLGLKAHAAYFTEGVTLYPSNEEYAARYDPVTLLPNDTNPPK